MMFKRILFFTMHMIFFALVCIYSLFVTCIEGNYLNFDILISLLFLILISSALACQSLYYLWLLLEKD
jgi:hypothetical protein